MTWSPQARAAALAAERRKGRSSKQTRFLRTKKAKGVRFIRKQTVPKLIGR